MRADDDALRESHAENAIPRIRHLQSERVAVIFIQRAKALIHDDGAGSTIADAAMQRQRQRQRCPALLHARQEVEVALPTDRIAAVHDAQVLQISAAGPASLPERDAERVAEALQHLVYRLANLLLGLLGELLLERPALPQD